MPIRRNIGGYITANPTAPTQQAATGVWGLVQQLQASAASIWPFVRDPDFDYVSLLLPGNGTNGAQNNTFLDSSANNFTITRNGDTTQGSFSPYGDLWSNYFDGTGDYLSVPDNAAFDYGTGSFTVEFWMYALSAKSAQIYDHANSPASGVAGLFVNFNTNSTVSAGQAFGSAYVTSQAVALNTWHHVAVVRDGAAWTIYINGVSSGTGSNAVNLTATGPVTIGGNSRSTAETFNGYISNLRVVKGTAVYTAAFTPPTAPLTAITNTSLLTCQSNRFRDASTNNFAITVNGNTSVTNFAPFNPSAAYDPAVNGGSGYFDGVDDYLSFTDSTWSGVTSATIEMWAYPLTTPNGEALYADAYTGAGDPVPVAVLFGNNAAPLSASGAFLQVGTYTGSAWVNTTGTTISLNAWTHIAAVYSSSTWKLYVNGSLIATSATVTLPADADATYIARRWDNIGTRNFFNGYIAGLRVLKGTALYTSTFTPPTSPPTAITNTNFLAKFTNAGIVDASAKNDLVTVGNAQISTAQSKFGGSSMAFDGTGDYLSIPDSAEFDFGTGNFTVEAWVYHTISSGTSQAYFTHATGGFGFSRNNAGALVVSQASVADITSGGSIPLNAWTHIAVCRTGTSLSIFINGTAASTVTNNTNFNGTTAPQVGAAGGSLLMNGYIDDLRITKGVARYTANFTPPTAPFPLA